MAAGRTIVVDDTFCYRWIRDPFRSHAAAAAYRTTLNVVSTAREEILARHSQLSATGERPVLSRACLSIWHPSNGRGKTKGPSQSIHLLGSMPGLRARCLQRENQS
jgi:hypothetical protein